MDVYYHVEFQLCITSGSKVSRGVQNCTPPGIGCVQTPRPPPGIGLTLIFLPIIQNKNYVTIDQCFHGQKQKGILWSIGGRAMHNFYMKSN